MNTNPTRTIGYDESFTEVQNLTWLPWVGSNFSQRPPGKRLLVIGESHYVNPDTKESLEAALKKLLEDAQYTRTIVHECPVRQEWRNKTLDRLPKLLFKTDSIDRIRFWSDTAFYNLVQRPMDYARKPHERPTGSDFVKGWRVFSEVVRIIKPSHCLFIGVEAAKTFDYSMTSLNLSFTSVARTHRIRNTWARAAKLEVAGTSADLIFVKHLAMYFSWALWHDYLHAQHSGFMNWLQAESYAINHNAEPLHTLSSKAKTNADGHH